MGEALFVKTFGQFEAVLDKSGTLHFGSRRSELLLVYLALNPGRHSFEDILQLLWGSESDAQGCVQLHTLLEQLPDGLKPFVIVEDRGLSLNPERSIDVDALHFANTLTDEALLSELALAASLYGGDFLRDFMPTGSPGLDEWVLLSREHFRQLMLNALSDLVVCYSTGPDPGMALTFARRLVEIEPFMERNHRLYMRLLAKVGRPDRAATQYFVCRTIVMRTFGVEPVAGTRDLYLALNQDLDLTPAP